MTYPPPQGPYPGMPPYWTGYGMPIQPPSGGTAITAGVLAILGAIWAIIFSSVDFNSISAAAASTTAGLTAVASPSDVSVLVAVIWVQAIIYVLEVFTLGPGSILLLTRRTAGRWLVAVGCALHIIQGFVAAVALFSVGPLNSIFQSNPAAIDGGVVGLLIVLAPAIATLVLVSVPLTGRWCAWRTFPRPGWR